MASFVLFADRWTVVGGPRSWAVTTCHRGFRAWDPRCVEASDEHPRAHAFNRTKCVLNSPMQLFVSLRLPTKKGRGASLLYNLFSLSKVMPMQTKQPVLACARLRLTTQNLLSSAWEPWFEQKPTWCHQSIKITCVCVRLSNMKTHPTTICYPELPGFIQTTKCSCGWQAVSQAQGPQHHMRWPMLLSLGGDRLERMDSLTITNMTSLKT